MRKQRRVDTQPELSLRRVLHSRGHRYRVGWPVPGRPRRTIDLAFLGPRVAVFVDGCFWHSCPEHATSPQANRTWWAEKLRRNADRDADTDHLLELLGWTVVRVWEHEAVTQAASRVEATLRYATARRRR